MNISTNTRYAIRLLFELQKSNRQTSIALLSERIGISFKTAEKIHTILKKEGITEATLGPKGGVSLKRSLHNISLGQMITLFDGGVNFSICQGEKANECPNQFTCANSSGWGKVSQKIQEELNAIPLTEILYDSNSSSFIIPKYK